MAVKIAIERTHITGGARVLNDSHICGSDVEVHLSDVLIDGKAKVLENLDIGEVYNRVYERSFSMDQSSHEYSSVQELLAQETDDKRSLAKGILRHIAQFSEGVVASIVANMLLK